MLFFHFDKKIVKLKKKSFYFEKGLNFILNLLSPLCHFPQQLCLLSLLTLTQPGKQATAIIPSLLLAGKAKCQGKIIHTGRFQSYVLTEKFFQGLSLPGANFIKLFVPYLHPQRPKCMAICQQRCKLRQKSFMKLATCWHWPLSQIFY